MTEVLREYKLGFVQGNFDQSLLFLPPEEFKMEAERYLMDVRALRPEERAGWVCGLGHGVLQGTSEENVRAFVRLAREILK
jgi:uroporphyrinogen decarboxylase